MEGIDNDNESMKNVMKVVGPLLTLFGVDGLDHDFEGLKIKSEGNMNDAFAVGLDYFFGDYENAKPGFQVGYLQSGKRKIFMSQNGRRIVDMCNAEASSTSVMVGVKVNYDISEEFSLNGKLFTGIAFNRIRYDLLSMPNLFGTNECAFAANASVGAQYLFTKKFGLGLDLGYRPFPSDLSGFTAKLGLNFKI